MDDILVRPTELRQTAEQLSSSAQKIGQALHAIDNDINALKGIAFMGNRADDVQVRYAPKRDALLKAREIVAHFAEDLQSAALCFELADKNGLDKTLIIGFDNIKQFDGEIDLFPGLYGRIRENFLDPADYVIDSNKIRQWVRDAAEYNDIPPELLAVILQQENAPDAPGWRKPFQYIERQMTTGAAILNEVPFVENIIPDKIANSSTGIGNMTKKTLDDAAKYIETTYNRSVLPQDVFDTAIPFVNRDTRISGVDMQADIYYVSAHLRQLIDREIGEGQPYHGPLTKENITKIAAAYNGSGDASVKYGNDAVNRLEKASNGEIPLYFF
jgi:uncharacterized protein YukE